MLRDADIEFSLQKIAAPVLRAAGLNPKRVKIIVVNDASLNAFVVSHDAIFIHYGLINKLTRVDMLQGVIAHEAAHIKNGHISRRINNLARAKTAAGFGMALAVAAAATGQVEGAVGLALGTQSAAQRAFFKHTRAEEASADQAAVRYLHSAGISAKGLFDVMNIFRGQELLSEKRQDAYVRTHPLSRDRMRHIEAISATQNYETDKTAAYWFARAKGKLSAFKRSPKWTFRKLKSSPYKDIAKMRAAIAYHRNSQVKKAISAINEAIALRGNDPYLYDLKGQILLESRQFQAAIAAYDQAAKSAPNNALILAGFGRAQLAGGKIPQAKKSLEKSLRLDFRNSKMLRDLSLAYAKSNQPGMAALVTAQRYALQGRLKDAKIHAKRAVDQLPNGSSPWQKAQDVLVEAQRNEKQRK